MGKIKEVMGLVDLHRDLPDSEWRVNASREFIESKLRELLERVPVAHLWQHSETGRTRVIMAGDVWTSSREWSYVGPLVLGIGNDSKGM